MSEESQLPVYKQLGDNGDTRYFLRGNLSGEGDTEISEEQYAAITEFGGQDRPAGQLSDSDILRLHQEQDPASEFYKGKPVDNEVEEPVVQQGYYDLGNESITNAQIADQGTDGDTTHHTFDVSKTKSAEDFNDISVSTEEADKAVGDSPAPTAEPDTNAADTQADTETKPVE